MKDSCHNCASAVGKDYCTQQQDMEQAQYVRCKKWQTIIKKAEPIKKERRIIARADEHFESQFMKFCNRGGHYSFRTKAYIGV